MLEYKNGKSAVHSLDVRLKLALLAAFMLAQIFAPLSLAPAFMAATLGLYLLARVDFVEVVRSRKALLLLPLIPSLIRVFFETGWTDFLGIAVPLGIHNGALNFLFLCSLLYTPLLFALTTAPSQISAALRFYRMPKRWAFIFSVAFVSVNYIKRKAERTLAAQRARGCKSNALALMLPVLHSCFLRAKTMSLSMAARGFDADAE